jgi:hypothetical protein
MLSVDMISVVNAECQICFNIMVSVIMQNVIMLSFIMQSVIMLSVIMLSAIMLSDIMLSVIMLNVDMLSVVVPLILFVFFDQKPRIKKFRLFPVQLDFILSFFKPMRFGLAPP